MIKSQYEVHNLCLQLTRHYKIKKKSTEYDCTDQPTKHVSSDLWLLIRLFFRPHFNPQPFAGVQNVTMSTALLKKTSSWTKTKRCTLQRFYHLKREFHVVFSFLSLLSHLSKAQKQPVSPNYLSHRAQSGNLAQSRLWFIEPDDLKLLGATSQPTRTETVPWFSVDI